MFLKVHQIYLERQLFSVWRSANLNLWLFLCLIGLYFEFSGEKVVFCFSIVVLKIFFDLQLLALFLKIKEMNSMNFKILIINLILAIWNYFYLFFIFQNILADQPHYIIFLSHQADQNCFWGLVAEEAIVNYYQFWLDSYQWPISAKCH